jgi:PhnB protein
MNSNPIQPYLLFNGRCKEALDFYGQALGAKVEFLMLYKESPAPIPGGKLPAGWEDKVMHATFRIGDNVLMASDGCDTTPKFAGFSLSISVPTEGEADRAFNALLEGGQVTMPLTKTFWSPRFGMLTDRFGLSWMVSIPGKQ